MNGFDGTGARCSVTSERATQAATKIARDRVAMMEATAGANVSGCRDDARRGLTGIERSSWAMTGDVGADVCSRCPACLGVDLERARTEIAMAYKESPGRSANATCGDALLAARACIAALRERWSPRGGSNGLRPEVRG